VDISCIAPGSVATKLSNLRADGINVVSPATVVTAALQKKDSYRESGAFSHEFLVAVLEAMMGVINTHCVLFEYLRIAPCYIYWRLFTHGH